jgi:hypothetical protein
MFFYLEQLSRRALDFNPDMTHNDLAKIRGLPAKKEQDDV